jgi:hypothetical protein
LGFGRGMYIYIRLAISAAFIFVLSSNISIYCRSLIQSLPKTVCSVPMKHQKDPGGVLNYKCRFTHALG